MVRNAGQINPDINDDVSGDAASAFPIDASAYENSSATPSPARELLMHLEMEHSIDNSTRETKWSLRKTLVFTTVTCSLFWVGVYLAVTQIF